jgi:hypothetical protein
MQEVIMSPDQLRDKAKELLGRAKKASNPRVKDALLEQAKALDAQARAVDRDAFVE